MPAELGLISNNNEAAYKNEIFKLTDWCADNRNHYDIWKTLQGFDHCPEVPETLKPFTTTSLSQDYTTNSYGNVTVFMCNNLKTRYHEMLHIL